MQQLRFGIITIQNVPWPTMVEQWQHMEELGFDSVWVADHFVNWRQPEQDWLEAWTLLPALATQTGRIRLGTLVTAFPLRNPAILARQALTLDHISGGRLEIGLGTGVQGDIGYAMTGTEDYAAPERVARFREAVEIIDSMLRNEVTSYAGKYYRVEGATMNPRPVQQPRPPLVIAALGPAMLKIAAQYADTWNTFNPAPAPQGSAEDALEAVRRRNMMLEEYCAELGRDPGEIRRSLLAYYRGTVNPFASVAAFEDFVGQYREAGMNEFIFYYPSEEWYPSAVPGQPAIFERVAREVIPQMRHNP